MDGGCGSWGAVDSKRGSWGRSTRGWWDDIGLMGAMESSSLCCELPEVLLVFEVEMGLETVECLLCKRLVATFVDS